jgi:hypothetical protein
MHWSQRRLCRKIAESLCFPEMYDSMPINMFFIVKIHWEPYFADNPRIWQSEGIAPLFLTLALHWGGGQTQLLYPSGTQTWYPLKRRQGGSQNHLFPLPEIEPWLSSLKPIATPTELSCIYIYIRRGCFLHIVIFMQLQDTFDLLQNKVINFTKLYSFTVLLVVIASWWW